MTSDRDKLSAPPPEDTALEPVDPGQLVVGPYPIAAYDPLADQMRCLTCLDATKSADATLFSRCYGRPDLTANDLLNKEFAITHYHIRPATSVDKDTGEVSEYDRTSLILDDGRIAAFGGRSLVQSLGILIALTRSRGPWHPAVKVRLEQSPTNSGGRWFTLVYLGRLGQEQREGKKRG